MSRNAQKLERLGEIVGSAFSRGCAEERLKAQKASLLHAVDSSPGRGPRRRITASIVFPAASAAAILLVVGAFLLWGGRDRFSGLDNVTLQKDGLWLEAPQGEPMRLSFNDGSEVEFDALARGRIIEASGEKVRIDLKAGKLLASIRKAKGVSWNFSAGTYLVTVKGTVFSLEWDDRAGALDLHVIEGTVLVTGNGIGQSGIEVSAGSRLRADGKTCAVSSGTGQGKKISGTGFSAAPSFPEKTVDVDSAGEAITEEGASPLSPAAWKHLVEQEKFSEAMALVRKEGLDKVIADLALQDLWQLADAARYARDGDAARTILLAVRERFGKSQKARIAAFLLGCVAAEIDKKPSEAVAWFKVYLREDPEGALSEEALGRLVDALAKAGRMKDAASAAKKYIEKYPNGFYAEMARTTIEHGEDE